MTNLNEEKHCYCCARPLGEPVTTGTLNDNCGICPSCTVTLAHAAAQVFRAESTTPTPEPDGKRE